MKKLFIAATIALFGFTANAQEEQTFGFANGDVIVEGNLGYNNVNDKNTEEKTNEFSINPKAGYFVSDDLAVGIELSYNSATQDVAGTETADFSAFGAGVFARYYFLDLGSRFTTYSELGLGFASAENKIADVKSNGFGAGLGLGINYFVKENIAINFGLTDVLSYNTSKVDADGAESVSEFNANLNVFNNFFQTAQFGLTFKF
ncbi:MULTISPECIES: outer membrane beta-barrel protein [Mesoflavibacter]|uniref:Porin family protein n=1 Tax=Mesoflavibacter profundi TaxID=2708110 RepID=A0ABT4RY60_9FLAO|nr:MULTISPECIES: outer membrane beta-barrel protein [Mesoflavibacter]MDA0176455.1 porin family protein [Mesoflavibacter profundi]QIJ90092.1 hypothetical protein C7H62_2284 [Mesoflavibacter sp. HG96]QIJ92820.1 hypothetical protein C7H56_2284 [Mesoflavibacter sp. HG37]